MRINEKPVIKDCLTTEKPRYFKAVNSDMIIKVTDINGATFSGNIVHGTLPNIKIGEYHGYFIRNMFEPCDYTPPQTVDEYLQANSLKTNELPKVDYINVADLDYKALYEAQTKAIEDAIAEMERKATKADELGNKLRNNDYHFTSNGLSIAIKTLKQKLIYIN